MIRTPDRKIILENGQEFVGHSFGATEERLLEIVFNTSMVGYQEILSDPSYTGQAVVMTYPLIGNYGMAPEDYETPVPTLGALIVREYNDESSNFRGRETLGSVMARFGIPGISGVDTRRLNRIIRDQGSMKALITDVQTSLAEGMHQLREAMLPRDAVSRVSSREIFTLHPAVNSDSELPLWHLKQIQRGQNGPWEDILPEEKSIHSGTVSPPAWAEAPQGSPHIVLLDCGMKWNIPRSLTARGCAVTVVPWDTDAKAIRSLRPDGLMISNGPGDPLDVPETIHTVRSLLGEMPAFGICLGHQILSLAYGAKTYKLKFGHRSGNHPVRNLETGRIEITSQNHSYAVDADSLRDTPLRVSHLNLLDGTVEGVACPRDRAFSVQFHPESAPGPQDSAALFGLFLQNITRG